ncbi:putative UDP-rhamnose:rhamnosyltransferase 1 [Phoenix dactylifera]|uniref:Glycosyltransferase n=1 Tax=Phoenix dactylifera TaxID=42345 RepID=A0A8B7C074_PHODC|nr:putative UDP-rhamnose:rhamnosyltransferase 1 [Phoenix dactylifera]
MPRESASLKLNTITIRHLLPFSTMDDGPLHVVVFPWLAFGHMLPFLELSKSLAKRGHRISFLSTPRNIQRLPKIPSQIASLVDLVSLPLPKVDGLPEDAEATTDIPPPMVQYLMKAFDGLDEPFTRFLREASPKPDWIIHDFSHHWIPPIASMFEVPCAFFSIFPSSTLVFIGPPSEMKLGGLRRTPEQFTKPPEWISFPSSAAFRLYEARLFTAHYRDNASGFSEFRRLELVIQRCKLVAVRSCKDFESDWLPLLEELYEKKPVVPAGLLPPHLQERIEDVHTNTTGVAQVFGWLNGQTLGSVVYVALGSEATLSVELVHELALGLELSKVPFVWALRKPAGMASDVEILPKGFEVRTRGLGVVAMGWIPQLSVLAHPSVGGFFTHCGWSSIIEGLQFGHPLILLPIFADHGLNARIMEDKRIGLEVPRDEEDGSFGREGVAKVIRLIMVEEEGKPFRCKAGKLKEVFSDKESQERYVDNLVRCLQDHGAKQG